MKFIPTALAFTVSASVLVVLPSFAEPNSTQQITSITNTNELSTLIEYALINDASREQFSAQSQAIRATGVASSTLMDPKIKLGFGGLPVDSFEFDVDPMTSVSVGLMQQFERGSTLELQKKKANQQADGVDLQVNVREREVANALTKLWLELGYQQQAELVLIENQRLMDELTSFIQTNYSIGKNEAQDLLNAQLQVSKLEEKYLANQQIQRRLISQLSEWLGSGWLASTTSLTASNQLDWHLLNSRLSEQPTSTQHYALLNQHPMVKMADVAIASSETQVNIAEQAYKPQFGVEVMYANRQANNMMGEPASDLVSAYVTMDIPLFTGNRQDKNHEAAQYQVGAAKSQKDLLLSQMNAKVNALLVDRSNLEQRLERYNTTLLQQADARIKAVERGYQNNTSQFNDVIAATNDQLALKLERERLITDLNIVNSELASLLGGFDYQAKNTEQPTNTNSKAGK
ncbi:TolC family protein [Vibrio sp. T187]|uniref:TolC family protein n=1 Tax=Vibrio TaxID=662 RepID=UPI0010C9D7F4|nr:MULTISPECIES: TolC family protein [Vibrio]MBW3695790.1 TolC family protein [Vibrio sp. T187]